MIWDLLSFDGVMESRFTCLAGAMGTQGGASVLYCVGRKVAIGIGRRQWMARRLTSRISELNKSARTIGGSKDALTGQGRVQSAAVN